MEWVSDRQSPYGCRLVCAGTEIDDLMEEHYLKFYNGAVDITNPALDIERFIEDYLQPSRIEYDPEATDLGRDVLGVTQFNPDGSRLIRISKLLYLQRHSLGSAGRFRFTCAHEAFHAMFHHRLFSRGGRSICLERHIREDFVEPQLSGDFTEWQANRGAAALLMPKMLFMEHVTREKREAKGNQMLADVLADRFRVSRQSAQIRLQTLGLWVSEDQASVLQTDGIDSYVDPRHR